MRSEDLRNHYAALGIPMAPADHPIYSEGPQITLSSRTRAPSPAKDIVSLPQSSESEEEGESDNMCPYCSSEGDCEHLLLSVDVTFREAGGGELYEAFNSRWFAVCEDLGEDGDFDEREEFDTLLEEVSSLSGAERYSELEGGPGQSSAYQNYYCSSAEAVANAVAKWSATDK